LICNLSGLSFPNTSLKLLASQQLFSFCIKRAVLFYTLTITQYLPFQNPSRKQVTIFYFNSKRITCWKGKNPSPETYDFFVRPINLCLRFQHNRLCTCETCIKEGHGSSKVKPVVDLIAVFKFDYLIVCSHYKAPSTLCPLTHLQRTQSHVLPFLVAGSLPLP
jgi:hypothetical protein